MITLESIAFNHRSRSANGALNLRRNASTALTVPEWRRGTSVTAEDCPVAYAMDLARGATLTVVAKFRRNDPSVMSVTVRTFNPNDTRSQGCLYALLNVLGAKFVWTPPPPDSNVLGEVAETLVTFGPHDDVEVELPLTQTELTRGVGIHYETWHWQYLAGGTWTGFAQSKIKVYVLLGGPTAPWSKSPGASNVLWTDVLDFACSWAGGATDRDAAAAGITAAVYDLGPSLIEYDCPSYGETHYSSGSFDCSSFLDRLRGGPGRGRYVNCTDCATIVSTFANALGCDLWQSTMGYDFDLNAILAIGSSTWRTACGWGGFSYHEVAWKGACTESDRIFDACLKVDGDSDPTTAPYTPLLPVNMVFGAAGAGAYRDRLATPAGRATCVPQPGARIRRPVY
jgi:hypothetical protein